MMTIMYQNVYMFNSSLVGNINFGRSQDKEMTEKELAESGVAQFLYKTSDETTPDIGESGNKLSSARRKRVVLARVLLNGFQILLLDDAVPSLDSHNTKGIET